MTDTPKPLLHEVRDWIASINNSDRPIRPLEQQHLIEHINTLLAEGVDLDSIDDQQVTLLATVSGSGCLEAMRLLIKGGAKVNTPAAPDPKHPNRVALSRRHTPLMIAASFDQVESIDLLVQAGADLDAGDEDGESALFWAGRNGSPKALLRLIEHGADIAHKDNLGGNAMTTWAAQGDDPHEKWFQCGRILARAASEAGHHLVTDEVLDELDSAGIDKVFCQELMAIQAEVHLEASTARTIDGATKIGPRL